jgi:hypothetical protein
VSAFGAPAPRLIAFGDLETAWGVALWASRPRFVLVAGDPETAPLAPAVELCESGEIAGEGILLRVEDGPSPGCRIEGEIAGLGSVSLLGAGAPLALDRLPELDSLRLVLAWIGEDDVLALTSSRPRGADGHGRDETVAEVHEPGGPLALAEARLSSTYGRRGEPRRVGIELWPAEEQDAYPHRSGGEADGAQVTLELPGALATLTPLRCHRAGRDGRGVYLLARAR